jgi:hypothetical protein
MESVHGQGPLYTSFLTLWLIGDHAFIYPYMHADFLAIPSSCACLAALRCLGNCASVNKWYALRTSYFTFLGGLEKICSLHCDGLV